MIGHAPQHSVSLYRRAVVLSAVGTALAAAAATRLQAPLGADARYPLRVAVIGGGLLIAALVGLARSHRFARLGSANILTGARALAVALIAGIALAPEPPATAWTLVAVASLAATADLFDGPLARRSGLASRFGARFDMEIDAVFILILSILAWRAARVGPWILTAGLMRYAFIAATWLLPWMRADLPPSRRRQVMCVAQIVALIVAITPGLPLPARSLVSATGLALLVWSFALDTQRLFARRHTTLALR